jgi:hypothetical protein
VATIYTNYQLSAINPPSRQDYRDVGPALSDRLSQACASELVVLFCLYQLILCGDQLGPRARGVNVRVQLIFD